MPIAEAEAWRRELLSVCELDLGAEPVPQEELDRRCDRYVELADLVSGDEGPAAVAVLIASLRAEQDYGAHQAVYGALQRFPANDIVEGAILAAADLLALPRDNSGQVLQLVTLVATPADLEHFRRRAHGLEPGVRQRLHSLVQAHEQDEWLAGERSFGRLR
ncbi:hypothetical protein F9C11_37290 [Amycolatopsis sp. VS8301801F10]|uniref:hypothetical protein n=1 Tax=Amycolatopsis sp. VS8301801F10 TaxID=2652442 RepID=UPI0038FC9DD8